MGKKRAALTVTKQVVIGDLTFKRIGDGPVTVEGTGEISADDFQRIGEALAITEELEPIVPHCDHHHCNHFWWNTPQYTYTSTGSIGTTTYTIGDLNSTSDTFRIIEA